MSSLEQDIDALHRLGLKWLVAFQKCSTRDISRYARSKERLRAKMLRKYGTVDQYSDGSK